MLAILRGPRVLTVAAAIAATVFSEAHCRGAQAVNVFNPSFEQPVVSDPSGIAPAPSAAAQGAGPGDSPWVFSAGSGIAAKGATFAAGFQVPTPPDGNQWAYLEQVTETVSQVLTFPAAGQYTLTFDEAGDDLFAVFIDNSPIAKTPVPPVSPSFVPESAAFSVTAGRHTLTFQNADARLGPQPEPPVLIDAVAVVPEPTWCALLLPLVLLRPRRPG